MTKFRSGTWHLAEIKHLKVGKVDRVIPERALVSPSHHVEAVRIDEPPARNGSPLPRNGLLDDDDRAKGPRAVVWLQRIAWINAYVTHV
jgi:hypothetical protein